MERAIRYIRDNFFAARAFTDIEDLNAQARTWCEGPAADRPCPGEAMSVREAFTLEAPRLAPLPDNPFPLSTPTAVAIGKTPYARFDRNDYTVPHTHVRRQLTVFAGRAAPAPPTAWPTPRPRAPSCSPGRRSTATLCRPPSPG